MNGVHVRMPALRQILAEAPEELHTYVRGFVTPLIDDPGDVAYWTERVVNSIHATKVGYTWPRNLRELKNYTDRYVVTNGRMAFPAPRPRPTEPAAPAGPMTETMPSSGLLGRRAKLGAVSLQELIRAYVTHVYLLANQNKAETARKLGLNWRTVSRLIDPERVARWLARRQ
jgi:DNA-binding NtrC family response regulator